MLRLKGSPVAAAARTHYEERVLAGPAWPALILLGLKVVATARRKPGVKHVAVGA